VPFLRRPFSIAALRRGEGWTDVELLYRVVGPGTQWMASLQAGAIVNINGPLGRPFRPVPDAEVNVLVGGGTGVPPIMWLSSLLAAAGRRTVAVCGARTRDLVAATVRRDAPTDRCPPGAVLTEEFGETPVIVATDDGSWGLRGNAVSAARAAIEPYRGRKIAMYACGPDPMLRAVAGLAAELGVPCQLCLEQMMACGMGTCQSCVIRVRHDGPTGWRYALACTEGPVFDSAAVVW